MNDPHHRVVASTSQLARTANNDVYAPDGNGLDCGRDPGDVPSPPSASAAETRRSTALANGVSSLNLGSASSPSAPSNASTSYAHASSSQSPSQSSAHAAATALLSRTHSSSAFASHGAPSSKLTSDLDTLFTTRGGGLGTPGTGSQTPVMDPNGLGWPAKSTLNRLNHTPAQAEANQTRLASAIATVLECIGEDPTRSGLQKTPERYAKALLWMTKGYEVRLSDVIANAIFDEEHDEMVIVRDIEIFSLCEHHMVPFTGKVSLRSQPSIPSY